MRMPQVTQVSASFCRKTFGIILLTGALYVQGVVLSQAQVPAAAPKLVTLPAVAAVAAANPPVLAPTGPIDVSALAANLTANLNELGLAPADLTVGLLPTELTL